MNRPLNYTCFLFMLISLSCAEKTKGPKPETLILKKGDKTLLFYGSRHSNNLNDPMFEEIASKFHSFNPEYVLIEGGYNQVTYDSKEAAILEGEMAFASFLAKQAGVPTGNIDPPGTFVDSSLLQSFSSEAILSMYVLRQIYQYQREIKNNPFDFTSRITGFANQIIESGTLNLSDTLNFDQLFILVEKESNLSITRTNWKETDVFNTVYNEGTHIHSIYEKVLSMRDEFAIHEIIRTLKRINRLFIIMGGDHLRIQKDELVARFNQTFK